MNTILRTVLITIQMPTISSVKKRLGKAYCMMMEISTLEREILLHQSLTLILLLKKTGQNSHTKQKMEKLYRVS